MNKVLLSKKSDDWRTPTKLYEKMMKGETFDPCPYMSEIDGLKIEWGKRNYVNPPYSQLKKWIIKAIEEHRKGKQITMLIPARTDTKAFKMLVDYGSQIKFIIGRIKFNDAENAPFPSMLVKITGKKTKMQIIKKENL